MRAIAIALVLLGAAPAAAAAAPAGGTSAPGPSPTPAPAPTAPDQTGGTRTDATQPRDERKPRPRRRSSPRPVLTVFRIDVRRFYDLGRPARVGFRIDGGGRAVRVKLAVLHRGRRVSTIDLGERATGRSHSISLDGREGGGLPEGVLQLRLTARDSRGRSLQPSSRASATRSLGFYRHRFPLIGAFDYGGPGARFGAGRPGHTHQGQDLTAPSGTPVVAPRGGVVRTVEYQPGGAGNYIVVQAAGENRSYAFMHLRDGSTRVSEGQRVMTGERLADVGSTGASSGPHLHFEIWAGAWYDGGRPIDPLPHLRSWDAWS